MDEAVDEAYMSNVKVEHILHIGELIAKKQEESPGSAEVADNDGPNRW